MSAMLDLAIEAAVALDHLRLSTVKRLALDALNIAKSAPKEAAGLATVPACVAAQVLYEEGCFDQAEALVHSADRRRDKPITRTSYVMTA
jgi:hypothetical protein